ncbi:hypothetical protein NQZ79_g2425 [Umbelopsis isabellina]|nr:hypothetical protein NQZ79_g2425 [Umbelopsis isabellina]
METSQCVSRIPKWLCSSAQQVKAPLLIHVDSGGFDFANVSKKDWDKEKQDQPFLHIPVLTEFQEDGSKFVLAESSAINRYLAEKSGLMGSNAKETALISQFYESWGEIHQKYWPLTYQFKDMLSEEQIDKQMSDLREKIIVPILTKHDQALAKNPSGFYVGDKMSLADVAAAASLPLFDYKNEVTKATHPHLFALHEKLSTHKAFEAQEARFHGQC